MNGMIQNMSNGCTVVKRLGTILLCFVLILCGCGNGGNKLELTESRQQSNSLQEEENAGEQEKVDQEDIVIQLSGAVKKPGVYYLSPGSRLADAVKLAGGLTEAAAFESVNQAAMLKDGEAIYVSTKKEWSKVGRKGTEDQKASTGKINLNTATKEELMTLSGIGETRADSILAYREESGGFQTAEDLMKVPGIKEGLFRKIKMNIVVDE